MRQTLTLLIGLIAVVGLEGCAVCRPGSTLVDPGFGGGHPPAEVSLPGAAGPDLTLTLAGLPPITVGGEASATEPGQAVTRRDSIVLAAQASTLGHLLDTKARECCQAAEPTRPKRPFHGSSAGSSPEAQAADLRGAMLKTAASEARNQAAGAGVTLFHRLEQAVAQRQAVRDSLSVVDDAVHERQLMIDRGLTIPESLKGLSTRRLDLLASGSQLDQGIIQASAGLRERLNAAPLGALTPLWPVDRIEVDDRPIVPEAEVELGLARRPEIALLHRLDAMQGAESLRSLQQVLAGVNPLLGLDCNPPPAGHPGSMLALLAQLRAQPEATDRSLAATRRVWDAYRVERERQIAGEIRLAAVEVRTTLDRVRLASERVQTCQADLDQLKARADQDLATFASLVEARLALIAARSTLWEVVTAYLIAEAKLHQEQFRLL